MNREWKPGDVARNDLHGYRSIFVASCHIHEHGRNGGGCWHNESGYSDPPVSPHRPLAVIDPEDRKAVERLLAAFCWAVDESDIPAHPQGWSTDAMQAALREFADPKPPKPDEPLGLGAVVEDADGDPWVRTGRIEQPWSYNGSPGIDWAEIDAPVRILSDGVVL